MDTSRTRGRGRYSQPGGDIAALAAVVAGATLFGPPGAVAGTLAAGGVAALVDLRTRRLPNRLVLLGAMAALAGVLVGAPSTAMSAAAGALGLAGPLLVAHLLAPAGVGFGDVKLAATLGLAVGTVDARLGVLALCVASGLTAVVGLVARRPALPFGPGLVLGAGAAVVLDRMVWR